MYWWYTGACWATGFLYLSGGCVALVFHLAGKVMLPMPTPLVTYGTSVCSVL